MRLVLGGVCHAAANGDFLSAFYAAGGFGLFATGCLPFGSAFPAGTCLRQAGIDNVYGSGMQCVGRGGMPHNRFKEGEAVGDDN